jgi:hypothetical protein
MNQINTSNPSQLVDAQAQMVVTFLENVGLPSENIIANQVERQIIGSNLLSYLNTLDPEVKREARYLSKFVVGAGFGLFDYSLNAIWNEVVLDLRKKGMTYGLDIFFDAAVGGKSRDFYKSEEDLPSLKDSVLLDTCKKLELIGEMTYKKLKHILEMRNDIGISHPNNYSINAYELLGWLQTCVQDVLNDRPTAAAIQVQAFIANLKTSLSIIDQSTLKTIEGRISELQSHHCHSILRSIFGIFVAEDTDPCVRKNISLIAPIVWSNCLDDSKYKLGILVEGYNTNLHQTKYQLGAEFFRLVGGNAFRSTNERVFILDKLLDDLLETHNAWDNFHNEPPIIDNIMSYIEDPSDILPNVASKFVKVILICRIGRDVSYCNGVSPRGLPYYQKALSLLGDKLAPHAIAALSHYEISNKLYDDKCKGKAKQALQEICQTIINDRLKECFNYLITNLDKPGRFVITTEFKKLSASYVDWR